MTEAPTHDGSSAEVSGCVSSIIQAFTNGLDIFKRLRSRRRSRRRAHRRDAAVASSDDEKPCDAELQLSDSLRRGPQEITDCYEAHYSKAGARFAKGDALARASLAETLIKLNTGLVSIITAFLHPESQKSGLANLDYRSLTTLSNASRAEAVGSLNGLYTRLNNGSQLHVAVVVKCPRCGIASNSSRHKCTTYTVPVPAKPKPHRRGGGGAGGKSTARTIVTRVPIKSSSQTQLVIIRPRNTRRGSSASSVSSKPPSITSGTATPVSSVPPPKYSSKDPFPPSTRPPQMVEKARPRQRKDSMYEDYSVTTKKSTPPPKSPSPVQRSLKSNEVERMPEIPPNPATLRPAQLRKPPPSPLTPHLATPIAASPSPLSPFRRRDDKPTPSTYTFASDSTKLGEIPMRHWNVPFDHAEAERLNREAAVNGYPIGGAQTAGVEGRKRRGLFGFLRRGE